MAKCHWCNKVCTLSGIESAHNFWTLDHIVPMGEGGPKGRYNCVGCCYSCNNTRNRFLQKIKAGKQIWLDNDPKVRQIQLKLLESIQRYTIHPFNITVPGLKDQQWNPADASNATRNATKRPGEGSDALSQPSPAPSDMPANSAATNVVPITPTTN